jgi:extracellular elastinolytic metalloproteinase
MAIDRDIRDFTYEAVPASTGPRPDLDPFTGSIRRLDIDPAPFGDLSSPLIAIALAREASQASAFADAEPAEFGLPQDVRTTSAGTQVMHLQQVHHGIPVFQSGRTVQLRRSGRAAVVIGTTVEALNQSESEPTVGARAAVIEAAKFLAEGEEQTDEPDYGLDGPLAASPLELPDDFQPVQTATFNLPAQPTTFSAEPFEGPIKASLVYLYTGPDVRLAWQVELVYPHGAADYAVLVAAGETEPREILYASDRTTNLRGECTIHPHNPGQTPAACVPMPAGCTPATLKPAPPVYEWIDTNPVTSGNNVQCKTEDGPGPVRGHPRGGLVRFGPFKQDSPENYVTHTFYYCNLMHDFFEALGFDERWGNFQRLNHRSGAPGDGDPVDATIFDYSIGGIATMRWHVDGESPEMKVGPDPDSKLHAALDSEVIFHEYTHGVTHRLVGERLDKNSLAQPQCRGMGEGWSDFFALTFHNVARITDKPVIGDWLTKNPGGLRKYPYDDAFPDKFCDVGTGRYVEPKWHNIGEIWCATLMMAVRRLTAYLNNKDRAYAIAWQCIVDGLKLNRAQPSFLDARNEISAAIDDLNDAGLIDNRERTKTRQAFWEAFAHFGMGTNAYSPNASLENITCDDTIPPDVDINAQQAVVDKRETAMNSATTRVTQAKLGLIKKRSALNEELLHKAREQYAAAELAHKQAQERLKELQEGTVTA